MVNPVSLSRVQESVTVQTLECCSCLNAELKHWKWRVKAAGKRLGREGVGETRTRERAGEEHRGLYTAIGSGGLHPFRPFKTKQNKTKPQMPCQIKKQ